MSNHAVRGRRATGLGLSLVLGLAAAALLLLAAGRPAHAGSATTILVNPGGSIQAAINGANPNDTVQVNPGTYTESLTLSKTVNLVGTNSATTILQAAAGQRVITVTGVAVNASVVISGLTFQGGDVDGGTACPQFCGGGLLITETAQPRLQNLIVRNNSAWQGGGLYAAANLTVTSALFTNNTSAHHGGGLNIEQNPVEYRLVLSDTQFISNTAGGWGGGAFVFGTAVIENGRFERNGCGGSCFGGGLVSRYLQLSNTLVLTNTAVGGGGGIYNSLEASVSGGLFQGNSSGGTGGGLDVRGTLLVTGTQFISNSAETGGGGLHVIYSSGPELVSLSGARFERNNCAFNLCRGGALWTESTQNLVINTTDFISNTARGSGGAIHTGAVLTLTNGWLRGNLCSDNGCLGGGLSGGNAAYVSGVIYQNNTAQSGGGGAYFPGPAILVASVFQGNACLGLLCPGGAVRAENGLSVTNTQFLSNTSQGKGGGLGLLANGDLRLVNSLLADNVAVDQPGQAVWYAVTGGESVVLHSTFAAASSISGTAVYLELGTLGVTNTIVASYTSGLVEGSGTLYEDYNLFFNVGSPASGATSGSHHPTGDPLFANPAAYDYHLGGGSPAIDAGANAGVTDDFDGDARPLGLGFDLGYDELVELRVYLPLAVR
ncbi:MAG: hypothetical protein IT317_20185 [Anaerolineales bacterium]|nr:hypothetical protein [Anaerolineales bacterium]